MVGLSFLMAIPFASATIINRGSATTTTRSDYSRVVDEQEHNHQHDRLLKMGSTTNSDSHKKNKGAAGKKNKPKSSKKKKKTKKYSSGSNDDDSNMPIVEIPARCQEDDKSSAPPPEREPSSTPPPTDTDCLIAFLAHDIDVFDLSRYNEWFHDDSVLELAETGSYVGAANIGEYIAFTTASFYFDYYANVASDQQILYAKWVEEDQTCHAMGASVNVADFNTELTGLVDTGVQAIVGTLLFCYITTIQSSAVCIFATFVCSFLYEPTIHLTSTYSFNSHLLFSASLSSSSIMLHFILNLTSMPSTQYVLVPLMYVTKCALRSFAIQ